ncbi:MAG: DUF2029 domain-containing protein [Candidatus Kapabacteria bacterium]|jgi:hypothetical protein|nr:DUF2029 domain-containing protein [Candidatus Kapabacteria bacterium]
MSISTFQQPIASTARHIPAVLVCLCVYCGGFGVYSALQPLRVAANVQIFLAAQVLHSIMGFVLLLLLWQKRSESLVQKYFVQSGFWFALLFVISRAFVFPIQPWLSDDVWRYLWDGELLASGINPYIYPPSSVELTAFRSSHTDLYVLLDYRNYSTIYPPLAQYAFAFCARIGAVFGESFWGALWVWKSVLVLSEAAGLWLVWKALQAWKQSAIWLWAYLCLPLTALESCGQAHVDGLLLAPLGWLVFLLARRKYVLATLPIVLAGAIKILPIVLVLPLVRLDTVRGGKRLPKYVLMMFCVVVGSLVLWLPLFFHPKAWEIYRYHAVFTTTAFQFNGGVYYALCYCCEAFRIENFWLFTPSVLAWMRLVTILSIGLLLLRNDNNDSRIVHILLATFSAALLIAAKVHTWYFLPLLLLNSAVGWKWLYVLASGSMLSYAFYAVSPSGEQYWLEMAVWGLALCFFVCGDWLKKGIVLPKNLSTHRFFVC